MPAENITVKAGWDSREYEIRFIDGSGVNETVIYT
jgi:hypothetical protein